MILVIITLNAAPEKRKELLQTLKSIIGRIHEEKGCTRVRLLLDGDDGNIQYLMEEWNTREDLDDHIRSDLFGVLLGAKSILSEQLDFKIMAVASTDGMEIIKKTRGR